jgi:hypothetical protein
VGDKSVGVVRSASMDGLLALQPDADQASRHTKGSISSSVRAGSLGCALSGASRCGMCGEGRYKLSAMPGLEGFRYVD